MKLAANLTEEFLQAMSTVPAPVAVVTCFVASRPWGLTVSAVCSVSAAPPKMLVSIFTRTAAFKAISTAGHFGISFVAVSDLKVAEVASQPNMPKFIDSHVGEMDMACSREYGWHSLGGPLDVEAGGGTGYDAPMIASAYCHMDCSLARVVVVADHALMIGDVTAVVRQTNPGVRPALWWNREYHEVGVSPNLVEYKADV